MDFTLDTVLNILSLVGGGGIGAFFTWRYTRRKAKAEAESAEASAAKEVQDVYQQLIEDIKADRNEQKEYINELKDDRRHLRADRDELRKRQDELEKTVRDLQDKVARNGRMVESVRPFLCALAKKCEKFVPVTISDDGEPETTTKKKKANGTDYRPTSQGNA